MFVDNGFEDLDDSYYSTLKDLPSIDISFNGKTVTFHKRSAPDNLVTLLTKLEEVKNQANWKKK